MGEETTMAKAKGVLELDTIKMLNAKIDALTNLVSKSQVNLLECTNVVCETYGGSHSYSQCNMSNNEDLIHTTPNGGTTLDFHGQTRPPN